jgi:ABC-type transport system involved in multi-copper enzyme maturation permease subunit
MSDAVIRDRGYQRWEGKLTATGGRFGLIAGRMLRMTARQPWVIVMMILPVLPALVFAVLMYGKLVLVHGAAALQMQMQAQGGGGKLLPFASPDDYVFDAICHPAAAFVTLLMAMFAGGGTVADDARAGAFQFYFARPVTREQYLIGKLIPPIALTAIVSAGPAFLLGLLRIALSKDTPEALSVVALPFKALALGGLNAVVLGTSVCALSSLSKQRGYVQGGFAGLYFLPWLVALTFMRITRSAWPSLLSLRLHVYNVGRAMFNIPTEADERWLPVPVSMFVLAAVVVGSVLLLRRRLAAVEVVAG